jgi:hypothetical protein
MRLGGLHFLGSSLLLQFGLVVLYLQLLGTQKGFEMSLPHFVLIDEALELLAEAGEDC